MTIEELIKELRKYPSHYDVRVGHDCAVVPLGSVVLENAWSQVGWDNPNYDPAHIILEDISRD